MPPATRRRRAGADQLTITEADFSKGIISDAAPSALAPGQVVACKDFMLDKPGLAYKRGGRVQVGGTNMGGGRMYFVHYADFPASNHSEWVALAGDLTLYRLIGSTWTAVGGVLSSANLTPVCRPVMVPYSGTPTTAGKLIWPAAAGNDFPRVYPGNGAAVRAMTGPTSAANCGRQAEYWLSRLWLAASSTYEDHIWFSPPNGGGLEVESGWTTANGSSFIVADHGITGLAALQNVMIVFGRTSLERLTGNVPYGPGANLDHKTFASVGTTDARSIVKWNDQAIFANAAGVYSTTGLGVDDLTADGSFKRQWQSLTAGYSEHGWTLSAGMIRNYYIIAIADDSTTNIATCVCDVPRRVWWQITGWNPIWFGSGSVASEDLYSAQYGTARVYSLASLFAPTAATKNDAGSASNLQPTLTTRTLTMGDPGLKVWLDGQLMYMLVDAASDAPTLTLQVDTGISPGTPATVAEDGTFAVTGTTMQRPNFRLAELAEAVQFTLTQTGPSARTELYGIQARALPLNPDPGQVGD
jgi:hypothetical protein